VLDDVFAGFVSGIHHDVKGAHTPVISVKFKIKCALAKLDNWSMPVPSPCGPGIISFDTCSNAFWVVVSKTPLLVHCQILLKMSV
jgi:hypothetical protein